MSIMKTSAKYSEFTDKVSIINVVKTEAFLLVDITVSNYFRSCKTLKLKLKVP